jgi:hypothetical protein
MYRVKNKNKNKYIAKNCASRWSFTKSQLCEGDTENEAGGML